MRLLVTSDTHVPARAKHLPMRPSWSTWTGRTW